jgi:Zn finger protein HypA/HybF involved in hydrogenase expression
MAVKKKQRVARTRGSGTLTEAQFKAMIISALRVRSRWWKPAQEVKRKARVGKGTYRCQKCLKTTKNPQIDHIEPVVPITGFTTWDDYINRMFCEEDNFQCLCPDCHDEKTKLEKQKRRGAAK